MFTPNELVVYPVQGIGKIERIDNQIIGNLLCKCYIVRIKANNITLMVPVKNAVKIGMRPLVSQEKANTILNLLKISSNEIICTGQNWNRRFREYSERIKSADIDAVTKVLRELLLISRTKDLSFGERRLLDHAMELVTGEISEVLRLSAAVLREELLLAYSLDSLQKHSVAQLIGKQKNELCPVISG